MDFKICRIASAASTDGRMAAFREITRPGSGPPLHTHAQQVEVFHVIRGQHLFVVDGVETVAAEGDCLTVPAGLPHAFKNISNADGELHFSLLPAGESETFFTRLVAGDFDPADIPAFFSQFDIRLDGPPLP